MKSAIGTTSSSMAPRVATVWKMKLPTPTDAVTMMSASAG